MRANQFPIIDSNQQYTGSLLSTASLINGVYYVDYSGSLYNNGGDNLTIDEYCNAKPDQSPKVITWEEYDRMQDVYIESLKTQAEEITEDRFYELLEVLPPCRWSHHGGVEFFHVSERLYANLVTWVCRKGDKFYSFTDADSLPVDQIAKKVGAL